MIVKYKIEVPNELSAEFWKLLTKNFNVILTKRQHSVFDDTLYVELKITQEEISNSKK